MVASLLAYRKSGDVMQNVSITMENAEVQNANSQYATLYYFLDSLKNICGTTASDTGIYHIQNISMFADGVITHGLQQRCFGSVTFQTQTFDITYDLGEFAPYTISGSTTTYDVGDKINAIITALNIYSSSNWTFKRANFVIINKIITE